MSKHKETLTFNGFSGYYGSIPEGYGGFDWIDVNYLNNGKSFGPETGSEGFQNAIRGHGEACLGPAESGAFESVNPSETFSLKSMLASSGSSPGDPVIFTSYTYSDGVFARKASDAVYLTPAVVKIDFAKLGGKGDFQNIAAVSMLVGSAKYGSHHGYYGYGNGMVFDNLKVVWNGNIPNTGHAHVAPPHIHPAFAVHSGAGADAGDGSSPPPADSHSAWHSALASLATALGHSTPHVGLTDQFALPGSEHFGT